MKNTIHISVFVTLAALVSAPIHAAKIQQEWVTQLSVGEKGGPCDSAAATLVLRAADGKVVTEHPISLKPEVLGIAIRPLVVKLPGPGMYTAQADLVRCDGTELATEPILVRVKSANEARAIQINGRGEKSSWRFEYFGITEELSGNGVFQVQSAEPFALTNISTLQLQPCRLMLGAQIQVLEFVGDQWLQGKQYQFPDDLLELGPGDSVVLEVPRTRVIRGKAKDEPKPTGYALRVNVVPRKDRFQHLVAVDNPALAGPFPGACDAYYVDFEWPKLANGD